MLLFIGLCPGKVNDKNRCSEKIRNLISEIIISPTTTPFLKIISDVGLYVLMIRLKSRLYVHLPYKYR
jgi:hypothetical protein